MGCQKLLQLCAPIFSLISEGLGGVTCFLKLNRSLVLNLRNWLGKEKNRENMTVVLKPIVAMLQFLIRQKSAYLNGKIAKMVPLIISEYLPRAASEYLGYKKSAQKLPILLSKKTTKRGGGGQKSPILRRHSLWTAPYLKH